MAMWHIALILWITSLINTQQMSKMLKTLSHGWGNVMDERRQDRVEKYPTDFMLMKDDKSIKISGKHQVSSVLKMLI